MTIFTYNPNEADVEATGETGDPTMEITDDGSQKAKQSREKLEACVEDYNAMYQTQQMVKDSKGFYTYYKDIAKRMKERDKKALRIKTVPIFCWW